MIIKVKGKPHIDGSEDGVFVSRPCEAQRYLCDHCHLQSRCYELFDNGKTCPIIENREVWMRISPEDLEQITS